MSSATPSSATTDAPPPKLLKKGDAKPTTATQTTFGCQHIKNLLASARQQATDGYKRLIGMLQKEDNISYRIYKGNGGPGVTTQPTYLCMQCPNVSISRERHHTKHGFSVESDNGFLYCHECRDFVYDPTFEEIRTAPMSKKRKAMTDSSIPDSDKKVVAANTVATPCAATGLRGLYNMGQTCFMSVILQSLIHNPLIRTFYLAEGHRSSECEREACTSCALDDIFTDFYATEKHEGYGAVHMLQGCWKSGGALAGYSQQDAHEFLGFILNSLHEANTEDEEKKETRNCECVIHQTFAGMYRSTVKCTTCQNTTNTSEAFMDLSLDVKSAGFSIKKKKLAMINGTQTVKEALPVDLVDCLVKFTTEETLPSESYHCPKCDAAREAKKKLILTRLPPVVPIHLKRFSHSKTNGQSTKVDTRVRFPFRIDLGPYTDSSTTAVTNGHDADDDEDNINVNTPTKKGDAQTAGEPQQPVYELSSVIVHKGKIDNGHYISYSKQGTEWFRFDDSMVVQVDEKEVLGAEAYMLFYVVSDLW
ncbi:hypothetical protein AC578_4637 [Pseudocercospora eumusae]|uniref:Ubiquitin carboxyl-terminal hydrolase n=1 Tax=Pseudocercospora eumusae TaxID=321146 RepID=A0A139H7E4_9PEZI|nr:hypothetical protein AC578_4637 [Pseudocercospora eumusae]